MRIAFIGCVEFSERALSMVYDLGEVEVVGVITKTQSKFNSDFRDLSPIAEARGTPVFFADKAKPGEMVEFLKKTGPTVIYCFGWSHLLDLEILILPPLGVVGFHPACLPQNRGRHPLVWALSLGLSQTASTFFFMDQGADSGDILSQRLIPIFDSDTAADLYSRVTEVALAQIAEFTPRLRSGDFERIVQDNSQANSWRKRNERDGEIDWRMSCRSIYNLTRALSRPYIGAHIIFNGKIVRIWRVQIVGETIAGNIEPGKVLNTHNNEIVVKCADGGIRIVAHEFEHMPLVGSYL